MNDQTGPGSSLARDATSRNELVFTALGGLGEIGMNVYLYGLGPPEARRWLMVDLGLTFPGDSEPGVDVVLPDLRFMIENRQALLRVLSSGGPDSLRVVRLDSLRGDPARAQGVPARKAGSVIAAGGRRPPGEARPTRATSPRGHKAIDGVAGSRYEGRESRRAGRWLPPTSPPVFVRAHPTSPRRC